MQDDIDIESFLNEMQGFHDRHRYTYLLQSMGYLMDCINPIDRVFTKGNKSLYWYREIPELDQYEDRFVLWIDNKEVIQTIYLDDLLNYL